ncbi:MAG TPA: PEP-CTERM sorting domain-containing protein, partial [Tepidisphaeraceae bacterium]|nr:PEP-CTERM sorting domain-containing protein [Tepidisphaeraceae bacterium]
NLNGKIDSDDFFLIDRGFSSGIGSNQYYSGDIDYNGVINADDYAYIDRAFAMQAIAASDTPATLAGISAVPEPTTVGLLTFLLPLLARRRRIA